VGCEGDGMGASLLDMTAHECCGLIACYVVETAMGED
jgi:hypothetical protein